MPDPVLLSGGAVLLTEPAEGTRSFVAGLWFPIGSRHEAPRERGFVHFVEHMLFKGTARRDASDIAREFDRVGGYTNAYTEKDCVCFHCIVPASAWTVAVDVLVDMVFASTFPEDEFVREQDVVASEILQIEDDPDESSHDEFMSRVWSGDPASLPIAGTAQEVLAMSRDEVYAFYRKHFTPGNLVVSVSSPLADSLVVQRFSQAIEEAFSRVGVPAACTLPATQVPTFRPVNSFHVAKSSQIYYYQAAQLDPPFGRKEYYTLSALNSIIGEAAGSRLFQSLRERKGLCYSVYSGFAITRMECLWMAQAVVQPGKFSAMVREFESVMDSVATGDISTPECEEAVSRLCGSYELALDDPDFRMRRLARQYMTNGETLSADDTGALYAMIRADEIRELALRLFASVPRARFAYGKHNSGALRAMTSDGGSRD